MNWFDLLRDHLTISPVQIAVMAIATWRLAVLFYADKGPWHIFERLRLKAGVYLDEGSRGFWGQQLACFWCVSLWAGVVVTVFGLLWWPSLLPLALSGAAMLLSYGGRMIWHEQTQGG